MLPTSLLGSALLASTPGSLFVLLRDTLPPLQLLPVAGLALGFSCPRGSPSEKTQQLFFLVQICALCVCVSPIYFIKELRSLEVANVKASL